jgi:phage-related protein
MMVAALGSTIQPASDLAETANKIQEVFGTATESITSFAAGADTKLGQSQQAAEDAAATFGVFGKSAGLSGGELAKFSTNLVGLSSNLASFYNTSPEEVIDAIGAALRGEAEPIRKYGVLLDAATLQQAAFAAGITRSTGQALTPQQKVLAANLVIMEQTKVAQGDFARTSDGLANSQRIAAAQIANLRTTIGKGLLPVVTEMQRAFVQVLGSDTVQRGAAGLSQALGGLGATMSAVFSGDTRGQVFGLTDLFTGLGKVFGKTDRDAASFGYSTAKSVTDLVGAFKSGFEDGGILGGITGLIGSLRDMSPVLNTILGPVSKVIGYFSDLISIIQGSGGDMGKLGQGIGGLLANIITDLTANRAQMMQVGIQILQGLIEGIMGAMPELLPVVMGIITSLIGFLTSALPLLATFGVQLLTGIVSAIITALPTLVPAVVSIISTLLQALLSMAPTIMQMGVQILTTLILGILPMLPMLIQTALQMLITLATGIAQALPILIPAVMQIIPQIITMLIQNLPLIIQAALQILIALVQGLTTGLPTLISYIPQIVQALFDALVAAAPILADAAVQLILVLVEGLVGALPSLAEAAPRLIQTIYDGAIAASAAIESIGKNIVEGVWQGIQARADWFRAQITAFFKGIIDAAKKALGINSPAKEFNPIGESIPEGTEVGVNRAMPGLRSSLSRAMAGLADMSFPSLSPSLGFAGAGASGSGMFGQSAGADGSSDMPPIHIQILNDMDARTLADKVTDYVYDNLRRRQR